MNSNVITDRRSAPIAAIVSIVFALLTLGYMLPWMIAALRGKSNHWAIMLLNLLLGWTFIGWVVALVMACSAHQVVGPRAPMHLGYAPPQWQPPRPGPQLPASRPSDGHQA